MTEATSVIAWGQGLTTKRYKKAFGGDGNVLYLDCGISYTGVYICQYSLNCTLQMDAVYCM